MQNVLAARREINGERFLARGGSKSSSNADHVRALEGDSSPDALFSDLPNWCDVSEIPWHPGG